MLLIKLLILTLLILAAAGLTIGLGVLLTCMDKLYMQQAMMIREMTKEMIFLSPKASLIIGLRLWDWAPLMVSLQTTHPKIRSAML